MVAGHARGPSRHELLKHPELAAAPFPKHLDPLLGLDREKASPQLISNVTDAVREEVGRWQSRPLDPLYALVFFVKVRQNGVAALERGGLVGSGCRADARCDQKTPK